MLFLRLKAQLEENKNPAQAASMKAAVKGKLKFLGVLERKRTSIFKPIFTQLKKQDGVAWEFVEACWQQEYREFQNAGARYLLTVADRLTKDDLDKLTKYVLDKPFWDTADIFAEIFGILTIKYPQIEDTIISFSVSDSIWQRRISILHQLGRGQDINVDLMQQTILANLEQTDFYVTKAIALILREYSAFNPQFVRDFIEEYKSKLTPLTIREAQKELSKQKD